MTPVQANFDPSASARAISLGRRTLVLVMFVLAAAPVVTLARGLELAALIHATSREGHRRVPSSERLHTAVLARAADEAARTPATAAQPSHDGADRVGFAAPESERDPLRHHVRTALLSLPPPPLA